MAVIGDCESTVGLDKRAHRFDREPRPRSGDQRVSFSRTLAARQAAVKQDGTVPLRRWATAVCSRTVQDVCTAASKRGDPSATRKQLIVQADSWPEPTCRRTSDQASLKNRSRCLGESRWRISSERIRPAATAKRSAKTPELLTIVWERQSNLCALRADGRAVEIQRKIVVHLILRSLALIAAICLLNDSGGWALQLALEKMVRDARQKQTLKNRSKIGNPTYRPLTNPAGHLSVYHSRCQRSGSGEPAGLTVVFQDFILHSRLVCSEDQRVRVRGLGRNRWCRGEGKARSVPHLVTGDGKLDCQWPSYGKKSLVFKRLCHTRQVFQLLHVGQWMWDEIKVSVLPARVIPPLIKGIYEATVKTTKRIENGGGEWKRVTHEEGSPQFSAMPSSISGRRELVLSTS